MVAKLFDKITRLSLRLRWITILVAMASLGLGIVALTQLNQELLPPIEFPAMVGITLWSGADAEQVLEEITIPLEDAVKDIEGIVNVESNTGQGFSAISLSTEFGLDQDTLKGKVEEAFSSVALPDGVDPTQLMSFSLGDIPVVVASVSSGSLSLSELKELVEASILPEVEGVPGVENVSVSGGQELPTQPSVTQLPEPALTEKPAPTPTSTPTAEPTATATVEPTVQHTVEPTAAGTVEPWPDIEPVPLPDEWVQQAKAMGLTLQTTADITPQTMQLLSSLQPQALALLRLEMWQALPPEVLAVVPDSALEILPPDITGEVIELVTKAKEYVAAVEAGPPAPTAASTAEPWPDIEPVPLPDEWVQQAKAMGLTLQTTADITPQTMQTLSSLQPQALALLRLETWQALPPEVLAVVPNSALEILPPDTSDEVTELVAKAKDYVAAVEAGPAAPTAVGTAEPAPDPDLLPTMWGSIGMQQGITLEKASDITVEILRGVVGIAPQLLDILTPHHLKNMSPEVLAWLPANFVDELPADLRAELDQLAAPASGLGAAARQETEEAARLAPGAPPMPESWQQPGDGSPQQPVFETASDLINNPFGVGAAQLLNLMLEMGTVPNAPQLIGDLTPEIILWLDTQDPKFLSALNPGTLRLFAPQALASLPMAFLETLEPQLRDELAGIAQGTVTVFIPEDAINRTNGNPSLSLVLYKGGQENTVVVAHAIFDKLQELEDQNGSVHFEVAFEQSSFIEESIRGVSREGVLGAVFAVVVILIFLSGFVGRRYVLSWRSTLVTAVSIPLSVLMGFAAMNWSPALHDPFKSLADAAAGIPFLATATVVLVRLFPESMTLNIMTLSGMTVAVGRVVDDSIVVLENIYRRIQRDDERREAVIEGTREVAIAIFASTVTTVIVFLPLGLIGGLVGEFFMSFGLAVAYALMASFLVAITVVPVLAYLLMRKGHMPEASDTWMQRAYTPMLKWALGHRFWTLVIATALFAGSLWLLGQRPQAFIPSLGEPTINVTVDMPNGTKMAETDALAGELEAHLATFEGIEVYETTIGSSAGMSMEGLFASGIDQGAASVSISTEAKEDLERLIPLVRAKAEEIFGAENVVVSGASMASMGFGFSMVLTGDPEDLAVVNEQVITALEEIDGLANVSSNLTTGEVIIRVDGQTAVSYSAELETRDSMGVQAKAKSVVAALGLPASIEMTEGFESREQTKGFADMGRALMISILVVYIVLALTFRSLIHPFTILFSLPLAVIGAALALAITDRVLGISAMIGLMMLVGVVVTNAIVLLERVQQNRNWRSMNAYDALVEGGRTRLRPIWMTALAAVLALIPLALGFTEGAVIASELATVVIGGLLTSTLLTLIIVPVAYSLFDQVVQRFTRPRSQE